MAEEEFEYKSRTLTVREDESSEAAGSLSIDGSPVEIERDEATGLLWTQELPYQSWKTLTELGHALIDNEVR